MKLVKSLPKYKCDFCKRRSTKASMERHEKICWRNPDRYCENCKNTKTEYVDYGYGMGEDVPCHWCSQFDAEKTKKIDEYYASLKPEIAQDSVEPIF